MSGNSAREQDGVIVTDSGSAGSNNNTQTIDCGAELGGFKEIPCETQSPDRENKGWTEDELQQWRVLGSVGPNHVEPTEEEILRTQILHFCRVNKKKRKAFERFLKHDFDFMRKTTTEIKLNLRVLNSLLGEK